MNVRVLWAASLLAAAVTLAGCGPTRKSLQEPEVSVKGVTLTRVGPTSADAVFTLVLRNPNAYTLQLHGVNFDLALNSHPIVLGDSQQKLTLAAEGTGELPLPVTFRYARVFDSLSTALKSRRVIYQMTGSVGIGPFRVPFASGGEFSLEQP